MHAADSEYAECAGEQDESAFDISQLQKLVGSPYDRYHAATAEKVMPPPVRSLDRPRKWRKLLFVFVVSLIIIHQQGSNNKKESLTTRTQFT